jgi:prolipoprotein diacylglyceryltransferase
MLAKVEPNVRQQIHTVPAISRPGWVAAVRFPPKSEPYKQQLKLGLIGADAKASLPVHPVQLYEALLAGALAWVLHRRFKGSRPTGAASLSLLAGYAVIRFSTEFLRADNKLYAFGLTISQVISVEILFFCAIAVVVRLTRRKKGEARQPFDETLPTPLVKPS